MNRKRLAIYSFVMVLFISSCRSGPVASPSPTPVPIIATATTTQETTSSPTAPPILTPTTPGKPMAVIFDDDGSPDGTTALLYLLSHPGVSLKAANISYGEAHPAIYIQHIGRMLDDFGIRDILLGAGQDGPLAGSNGFPEGVRQASNNFWGLPVPNPDKTYPIQDAAELIVSLVKGSSEPITIFMSGPSTNLAQALRLDPGIRGNIAAVYIMGGAVYAPGNLHDFLPDEKNTVAEWNIYADPQAAKEVFETDLDIYLVPLDATNQVSVGKQDTRQWRMGGRIASFAADIYDMLLDNWGTDQAAIWDLMTAALMVEPKLCEFRPLHLQVITDNGVTMGQTAVVQEAQPNINVCLEPDAALIRQTLGAVFSSARLTPAVTSQATATLPPAPVSATVPATTPENQIFRDDFEGALQPGWTWENEKPDHWALTPDGWLQILGEDAGLLYGQAQSNLLWRELPEGNFAITVHLQAAPVVNFQQATIYLYEDLQNYIAINRGFCGPCLPGGDLDR
jgi:pyrimidine-specific ribonucleoside hydrolase